VAPFFMSSLEVWPVYLCRKRGPENVDAENSGNMAEVNQLLAIFW
jgi:hypothetical protein